MKKSIALLMSLLLVVSLCACGTAPAAETAAPEGEESYKIGGVYPSASIAFCIDIQAGVRDAVAELGDNYSLIECVYDIDANKGVEMINNLITQQVDAIILHSCFSDAFAAPVESAMAAGIPVILVDSAVATDNYVTLIASDNSLGGDISGSFAVEYLGGEGKVLLVTCEPDNITVVERQNAIMAALNESAGIEATEILHAGTLSVEGFANTIENALNASPDYDMIVTPYSDCTYAAISVVEANPERFGDIKIIGYDSDDDILGMIESGTSPLIATVAQLPYEIGANAVSCAISTLSGETVEKLIGAEVALVTAENVSDYK